MHIETVSLHEATRARYLNYALSVITARALPDVRDGLKPVQRRILYTMFHELSLRPDGRYRKCAAVVGEVMGKYHPHGDSSIYDALVRMAQPFSLRVPLVDGHGNFGSLDGDPPAAFRYTECKLHNFAEELLTELRKKTVDYRPTYDGQRFEPVVLPAQLPHLLVNGSEGIAVGMATRIPPHNLGEVVDAAIALIDDSELGVAQLMEHVRGPDFPTGGQVVDDPKDLVKMYEKGRGSFKLRASWSVEKDGRKRRIIIHEIPYGQNKSRIIERIGGEIAGRKIPQLTDVRDESTDEVRIVLELKQRASADTAMAYLFRHTPLETSSSINLTALVPTPGSDVATPARLDLKQMLQHWLNFRFETIRRRLQFDLRALRERIHLLEGFEIVFDCLDEAIAIIRASEGKRDAGEKLMARFDLSEAQTTAILELRLYRLARLEILIIREELEEKRAEAERIEALLASDQELWGVVRSELKELGSLYADERRTRIDVQVKELSYEPDQYIIKEDGYVVVTRDGWLKRQSSYSSIDRIRIRDGDEIGWLVRAHTRSCLSLLSSHGVAYTLRVDDVPATTGYGEPMQRQFALADGERVVGVISHDARNCKLPDPDLVEGLDELPPPPWGTAMTVGGRILRFALSAHSDPSTRNGRKFARLKGEDRVIAAYATAGTEHACTATTYGRALSFDIREVPVLKSAGRGVIGIKLRDKDRVMAFELSTDVGEGPLVVTEKGREEVVRFRKFGASRGGKGRVVLKRGTIDTWRRGPVVEVGQDDEESN